jgi:hypothetical protein
MGCVGESCASAVIAFGCRQVVVLGAGLGTLCIELKADHAQLGCMWLMGMTLCGILPNILRKYQRALTLKLFQRPLMTLTFKHCFPLFFAMALAGCQSTSTSPISPPATGVKTAVPTSVVAYSGGDGSTIDKAVLIHATGERIGVRAEYAWLMQKYPGYKRISQSLKTPGAKAYDLIEIQTNDGRSMNVYFDISEFFGKF